MTERSQYETNETNETKLGLGIDCLIAEMNRAYGLDSPRGDWAGTRSKDEDLKEILISALQNIVRSRKISEMYGRAGLGKVGYRIKIHLDGDRFDQALMHCTCGGHGQE